MLKQVRYLLLGGLSGKILSLVRELLSAALFGAGMIASSFRLSQSAYLIPLQGFMSEALNSGFIPLLARTRHLRDDSAGNLYGGMLIVLLAVSMFMSTVLLFFAPDWVQVLAPGFSEQAKKLTGQMVQIMAISLPAYVIGSLYAAVEHAYGDSAYMAARASVQSVGLIFGSLAAWFCSEPLMLAVAFSAVQFLLLVWGGVLVRRRDLRWHYGTFADLAHLARALKPVGRAAASLIWVPVVMQVHFVVERRVASVVASDALSTLDYARFVSDTAVLLLAMPLGMAGLAAMSSMSDERFKLACTKSIRGLLWLGVPLSAFVYTNADLLVQILFQRGAFGEQSAATTAVILRALSIGMWAQLIVYASLKFLSARSKNKSVLIVTVIGVAVNISINYFGHDYLGVEVLGIASSANSLVMLGAVVAILPLARELITDGVVLVVALIAYFIGASLFLDVNTVAMAVAGACYWSLLISAWPPSRRLFLSMLGRSES
jgi:putative peptidoglycan lipid II flippase